jgi:hypothetical protein
MSDVMPVKVYKRRGVRLALIVGVLASVLVAGTQAAGAYTGSTKPGVKYLGTDRCPSDFAKAKDYSHKVGNLGVVEVYWKASTKENCVILRKTANVGKPTVTILALCSDAVMGKAFCGKTSGWQQFPADYGNFKYYAGPIVIKAPGCLWVAAVVSTKADPNLKAKGLDPKLPVEKFGNVPGSGRWGC